MADSIEVTGKVIDLMAALKESLKKSSEPCFECGLAADHSIHDIARGDPRGHRFRKQPYAYVRGACVECGETSGGHSSDCAAVD